MDALEFKLEPGIADQWRAESINHEMVHGKVSFVFYGPDAKAKAEEFIARVNAPISASPARPPKSASHRRL